MPELVIQENVFYKDYKMPLFYEHNADISAMAACEKRYRCIIITEGNGTLKVNGNKKIFVAPAILCLNEREQISSVESEGYHAGVFYFHPEIINSRFSYELINSSERELSVSENQDIFCLRHFFEIQSRDKHFIDAKVSGQLRLNDLVKKVATEISNLSHPLWPCTIRSYFLELLFFVRQLALNNTTLKPEVDDEDIERILLYINSNYHEKISIDDITRRFDTNRTTLSKKFLNVTGNSVISYLNKHRISIASMLLRDTTLPVNDIMYRVGFNDPTHFNKTFRQLCGMSPSNYRKNYTWIH